MDIKKLFGVLFVIVLLLTMPCAYALNDADTNDTINETNDIKTVDANNNVELNPFMESAIISMYLVTEKNSLNDVGDFYYNMSKVFIDNTKKAYNEAKNHLSPSERVQIEKTLALCDHLLKCIEEDDRSFFNFLRWMIIGVGTTSVNWTLGVHSNLL